MKSIYTYPKEIQDKLDKIDSRILEILKYMEEIDDKYSQTATSLQSNEFKAEIQICYSEINQLQKYKQDIIIKSAPIIHVRFESKDEEKEFKKLWREHIHSST